MMNPPPQRMPPEPDEPRRRVETKDNPLQPLDVVEEGGRCCLFALLPAAVVLAIGILLILRLWE